MEALVTVMWVPRGISLASESEVGGSSGTNSAVLTSIVLYSRLLLESDYISLHWFEVK